MKNSIIYMALVSFVFLVSCSDDNTQKKSEYRYIDILECSIPIPKKYEKLEKGLHSLYRFSFFENREAYMIRINNKDVDGYIEQKEFIENHKLLSLTSERKTKHLKILEVNMSFPNTTDTINIYYIYGIRTYIELENSDEKELAYLVDYCESTWKL